MKETSNVYSLGRVSAARTILYVRRELEEYLGNLGVAMELQKMPPAEAVGKARADIGAFLSSERLRAAVGSEPLVDVTCRRATWAEIYPSPARRALARAAAALSRALPRALPLRDDRLRARYMLLPYEIEVSTDMRWEELLADWYIEAGDDAPQGATRDAVFLSEDLCNKAQLYFNKYNPDFGWYMQWRAANPPFTRVHSELRVPGNVISVRVEIAPTRLCPEPVTIQCTVR